MPVKVKGQVAREHSYLFSSISKRVAKEWYVRTLLLCYIQKRH